MKASFLPENGTQGGGSDFNAIEVFKRLLEYLWRHKKLLFMIATALTEASFAALIEQVVNDGFVNAKEWHLRWLGLVVLGVVILRAVLGYLANYSMAQLGRYVVHEIRSDIFANLITLPTTYFAKNSSSKNVSKLIYDVEATATATTDTLTIMFKDTVVTAASVFCFFYFG